MATVKEQIDENIEFIRATASEYKGLSISYLNNAATAARGKTPVYFNYSFNPALIPITGLENYAVQTDLRNDFQNKYNALLSQLDAKIPGVMESFLNKYFPPSACWQECEEFLCNQLQNPTGLSDETKKQMWDKSRENEDLKIKALKEEVYAGMAEDGFSVPQIVVTDRIYQADLQGSKNISGFNRDITIKDEEVRIDFLKFAITSLIDMRKEAMDSALNYVQALMRNPDAALQFATGNVNAYREFYNSINTYQTAVARANDLSYNIAKTSTEFQFRNVEIKINQLLEWDRQEVQALVALAGSIGQQASSALNGVNGLVSLVGTEGE